MKPALRVTPTQAEMPDAKGIFDPKAGLHYPYWHDDAYNDFASQYNEEIDTLTRLRDNVWSGEGDLIAKHSTGGGFKSP